MVKDPAIPHASARSFALPNAECNQRERPLDRGGSDARIEVDAERLYALSQAYRTAKKEAEMFTALNTLAPTYPVSKWNEDGLMAAGNYHWVELEREKSRGCVPAVLDSFSERKIRHELRMANRLGCVFGSSSDADDRLTNFLLKYPVSSNSVDRALLAWTQCRTRWKCSTRARLIRQGCRALPADYFGNAATARLAKLGPGEENTPEVLEKIPPAASLRSF